jgi:hypothetical protein
MSIACCVQGCGASVCFDEAVESRLRRTHESWMCPFGHRQHFVAKTEDEERIEKLKKIISLRERDLRWWQTIGMRPSERSGPALSWIAGGDPSRPSTAAGVRCSATSTRPTRSSWATATCSKRPGR